MLKRKKLSTHQQWDEKNEQNEKKQKKGHRCVLLVYDEESIRVSKEENRKEKRRTLVLLEIKKKIKNAWNTVDPSIDVNLF